MEDIPFDLRAIRSQTYLHNGEGLERLKTQVVTRLKYLALMIHASGSLEGVAAGPRSGS
jgi:hypothetical protein